MIIGEDVRIHRIFFIILLLFGFALPESWAYTNEECMACHGLDSQKSSLTISLEIYSTSVHGRNGIGCGDCHNLILDENHTARGGLTQVGCLECHDQLNRHGGNEKNKANRPRCYDCHGTHNILEKENSDSSVHKDQLTKTCQKCHADECERDRRFFLLPSFRIATHVKQDFSKGYDRGHCLGCHQGSAAHGDGGIIHEDDCYRCHQSSEGKGKMLGPFHNKMDIKHQPGFFVAGVLNELIILAMLFCGILFVIQRVVLRRKGSE